MEQGNKKLDFDLEFLNKEKPKTEKPTRAAHKTNSKKWNWENYTVGSATLLVIVGIFGLQYTNTPSSTSSPPGNNQVTDISAGNEDVEYGEYRCSRPHYSKVIKLSPGESEQALKSAQLSMDILAKELERLQREIKHSHVNERSSQWEIDDYNDKVNIYNSKLSGYNRGVTVLDSRIDRFNAQVATHNNYLVQNCTPR